MDFRFLASPNGPGTRDILIRQEGQRVIGFAKSEMPLVDSSVVRWH